MYGNCKKQIYNLKETSERYTPNDKYENFVTSHLDTAAECIPTKPRAKCRVSWESLIVRKNKITLKKKSIFT